MNSLLDSDTEDDLDDRPVRARDREITLGTSVVLGIFFALAAYGAVLFGFGYSMGVKHLTSTSAAPETAAATFSGFKPPSGAPLAANGVTAAPKPGAAVPAPVAAGGGETVTVPDGPAPAATKAVPAARAATVPAPQPTATATAGHSAPASRLAAGSAAVATAPPTSAPAASAPVAPSAGGAFLVQVAAVSHQEDADMVVVSLKRKGYPVAVRHEPQDQLLHVQIGYFATKKDAEAMRQRLLADGFNAIVK